MGKFYNALGVNQNASKEEIKRAYKKLAVQLHPDKPGGDQEKFKELSAAYQVLSDDADRQRYDAVGDAGWEAGAGNGGGPGGPGGFGGGFGGGGHPFHGMDANNIFEQFFGGGGGGGRRQPQHRKCSNHQHVLQISLAEAFTGLKRTLKAAVKTVCTKCRETCYTCQGVGTVTQVLRNGFITQMISRQCEACKGNGVKCKGCNDCSGQGNVNKTHTLDIELPPGVSTGWRKMFPGLGEQASKADETSGDLIIEVLVIPDRVYERLGDDLGMHVKMTFAESVIGKELMIPSIVNVPEPIIRNTAEFGVVYEGETYRIAGLGMPKASGGGNRGDLLLKFQITHPGKLSAQHREIMTEAFKQCGWM